MDRLEGQFGHPGEMWTALKERIQVHSVRRFSDVQEDYLAILWSLDQYRVAGMPPRGMGNPCHEPRTRLEAVYRSKGIWWADLLALLLENRTDAILATRRNVRGFSQAHTIDVAWPSHEYGREIEPHVCLVTRLSGAPGFLATPPRRALSDWPNRRKELKFAAVDLKLGRRQHHSTMDSWDQWRRAQRPKVYFLWGARVDARERRTALDKELQALVDTYLDGAGVFAYAADPDRDAYQAERCSELQPWPVDGVLDAITETIRDLGSTG